MTRLDAMRARVDAGYRHPWTNAERHAQQDVPLLLAVAEAARDVIDWLAVAYPPCSVLDDLRAALAPLMEEER